MSGNIYNRSFFHTIVTAALFLLLCTQASFSISIEWMRDLDFVEDYHESGNLNISGFAITDDGNVLVGGTASGSGHPIYLAALDSDMDSVLWLTSFETEDTVMHRSGQVIVDENDNCLILGRYWPEDWVQDPVNPSYILIAADSEGDSLWSFSYELEYHPNDITFQPDKIKEVMAIPDNGYVLCGQGKRLPEYQGDHLLMLFVDEEGELSDEFRYSPGDVTFLNLWSMKYTDDDEIVVCGKARGPVPPYIISRYRGMAAKVSPEGELIRYNEYAVFYDDYMAHSSSFNDFIELPNSDLVLCGKTYRRPDLDDDKYWLAKVDEDGELEWSRTYDLGAEKSSVFTDIFEADGQFVCFGRFISEDDDIDRIIVVVFDHDGDLVDEFMFPEEFVALNLGEVVEVAEGEYICGLASRYLAKVNLIDNSAPALTDPPRDFNIISAYPNPFNSSVTITYSLSTPSPVNIGIYDTMGNLVSRETLPIVPAGIHTRHIEAARLPSGIYLLKLQAGTFAATRKIVKVN